MLISLRGMIEDLRYSNSESSRVQRNRRGIRRRSYRKVNMESG